MKQSINFHSNQYSTLFYTARKQKNHYELIYVNSGSALIRLGKWEYFISEGEYFWLPFDSLSAVTAMPYSHLCQITISIRTQESLPDNGGYVRATPLLDAIIQKLLSSSLSEKAVQHLLYVLQDELLDCRPQAVLNDTSKAINHYLQLIKAPIRKETTPITIPKEMSTLLTLREADKMRKSGVKISMIAQQYFEGDIERLKKAMPLVSSS